mmetsp:Transcript_26839/g.35901  ORF Transcript_26839/g.35901 Transcript_26839/m.35901 type:complete len:89 (+) Transcript_26839:177-443(+)
MKQVVRNSLNSQVNLKKDWAEDHAKQCLLWFMGESAYQWEKLEKFKHVCMVVVRLQRAYRTIKFRRIVRRSLMDLSWEKFVESQRKLA